MVVVMLITAVVLNQLDHLLPVQHASPTYYFSDIKRVGELTGWPTKDASRDSFPGDHGMMLMIFSAPLIFDLIGYPDYFRHSARDDRRPLVYRHCRGLTVCGFSRVKLVADLPCQ